MAAPFLQLETLVVHLMATGGAQFRAHLNSTSGAVGAFTNRVNSQINVLRTFTGFGLAGIVSMAIRSTNEFERIMTNTMSMMHGATESIRRDMEDAALALSGTVATNAIDLASAYYQLSKAGLDAAQSIEVLAHAERFAYINGVPAEKAARDITRIQRAMGTLVDDPMQNARNFEHIGNVISSVANRAGVETDVFMHALSRIGPHLRFLNKDLAEGASLIAAFSSRGIEAAAAGQMSRMILQNMGRLFIRSETPPNVMRGAREGISGRLPSGSFGNNRMFGVTPLNDATNQVRMSTMAWRNFGIEVFHTQGALTGQMRTMPAIISDLDRLMASLGSAEQRQRVLMQLGFQEEAARSIITLLGSGAAMEQFMLQARNADGIMEQIANTRLNSMSAQFSILRNNVTRVAIEIGRNLVPYLKAANQAVINFFRSWSELPDGFKEFVALSGGVVAALLIAGSAISLLTFPITGLLSLFSMGFYALTIPISLIWSLVSALYALTTSSIVTSTAVFAFNTAVNISIFVLRSYWGALLFLTSTVKMLNLYYTLLYYVLGTVNIIWNVLLSQTLWLSIWYKILATVTFALNVAHGLLIATVWAVGAAWTFVMGIVHLLHWQYTFFGMSLVLLTIKQVVLKGVIWLVNMAWTAMAVVLKYILAITGLIIISIAALTAVLMASVVVINVVWVGFLYILQGILVALTSLAGFAFGNLAEVRFSDMWDGFLERTTRAFWAVVGFFSNWRQNMDLIFNWMQTNWPAIIFNMTQVATGAFDNLWHNIRIGWARVQLAILQGLEEMPRVILQALTNPLASANATSLRERLLRIMGLASMQPIAPENIVPTTGFRPLTPFPELNLTVPERVRRAIQQFGRNVFSGLFPDESHPSPYARGQVGAEFKEISLKRFTLHDLGTDANRELTVSAPGVEERLDAIAALLPGAGVPIVAA